VSFSLAGETTVGGIRLMAVPPAKSAEIAAACDSLIETKKVTLHAPTAPRVAPTTTTTADAERPPDGPAAGPATTADSRAQRPAAPEAAAAPMPTQRAPQLQPLGHPRGTEAQQGFTPRQTWHPQRHGQPPNPPGYMPPAFGFAPHPMYPPLPLSYPSPHPMYFQLPPGYLPMPPMYPPPPPMYFPLPPGFTPPTFFPQPAPTGHVNQMYRHPDVSETSASAQQPLHPDFDLPSPPPTAEQAVITDACNAAPSTPQ
jgi:hypothetical protein